MPDPVYFTYTGIYSLFSVPTCVQYNVMYPVSEVAIRSMHVRIVGQFPAIYSDGSKVTS